MRPGSGLEWYGNGLGVVWEWSGSGLGMVWKWSGSGLGVVWEWSGSGLGMVWEWSGSLEMVWEWFMQTLHLALAGKAMELHNVKCILLQ